jgi:acylphosphatase
VTGRGYLISGVVQGVGFRWFVARHAEQLGLVGLVRNRPDGRVEVQAAGPVDRLASLEELLWKGPRFSNVTEVEVFENSLASNTLSGFKIIA